MKQNKCPLSRRERVRVRGNQQTFAFTWWKPQYFHAEFILSHMRFFAALRITEGVFRMTLDEVLANHILWSIICAKNHEV